MQQFAVELREPQVAAKPQEVRAKRNPLISHMLFAANSLHDHTQTSDAGQVRAKSVMTRLKSSGCMRGVSPGFNAGRGLKLQRA